MESLVLTNPERLQEIISQAIESHLDLATPKQTSEPSKNLLTRKETCELLQVSPVTLWQWDKDGKLKAVRLNSRVRYRMQDIEQFMNGQNQY